MAQMRLQFLDDKLKSQLEGLAAEVDLSLNMLVNVILSAHFNPEDRKSFQLMLDLAEMKRAQAV